MKQVALFTLRSLLFILILVVQSVESSTSIVPCPHASDGAFPVSGKDIALIRDQQGNGAVVLPDDHNPRIHLYNIDGTSPPSSFDCGLVFFSARPTYWFADITHSPPIPLTHDYPTGLLLTEHTSQFVMYFLPFTPRGAKSFIGKGGFENSVKFSVSHTIPGLRGSTDLFLKPAERTVFCFVGAYGSGPIYRVDATAADSGSMRGYNGTTFNIKQSFGVSGSAADGNKNTAKIGTTRGIMAIYYRNLQKAKDVFIVMYTTEISPDRLRRTYPIGLDGDLTDAFIMTLQPTPSSERWVIYTYAPSVIAVDDSGVITLLISCTGIGNMYHIIVVEENPSLNKVQVNNVSLLTKTLNTFRSVPLGNGSFISVQAELRGIVIGCCLNKETPFKHPTTSASVSYRTSSRSGTSSLRATMSQSSLTTSPSTVNGSLSFSVTSPSIEFTSSLFPSSTATVALHHKPSSVLVFLSVIFGDAGTNLARASSAGAGGVSAVVFPTAGSSSTKLQSFMGQTDCGRDDDDDVSFVEHPLPGPSLFGVAVAGPAMTSCVCFIATPLLVLLVARCNPQSSWARVAGHVAACLFAYFGNPVCNAAAVILTSSSSISLEALVLSLSMVVLCVAVCVLGSYVVVSAHVN